VLARAGVVGKIVLIADSAQPARDSRDEAGARG
jgi:hypothetical protein